MCNWQIIKTSVGSLGVRVVAYLRKMKMLCTLGRFLPIYYVTKWINEYEQVFRRSRCVFTSNTYMDLTSYITLQVLHVPWYERRLYMLCQQHPHYFWDLVFSIKCVCYLIATFQIQPWVKLRKSSLLWLWKEAKNFEF